MLLRSTTHAGGRNWLEKQEVSEVRMQESGQETAPGVVESIETGIYSRDEVFECQRGQRRFFHFLVWQSLRRVES